MPRTATWRSTAHGSPTGISFEVVRQFDVYRHPDKARRPVYPYLVVLQHDSVALSSDVVVAPLTPSLRASASRIQPVLDVQSKPVLLRTPLLGAVPRRLLRGPVGSLQQSRDQIIAAIDLLFVGS